MAGNGSVIVACKVGRGSGFGAASLDGRRMVDETARGRRGTYSWWQADVAVSGKLGSRHPPLPASEEMSDWDWPLHNLNLLLLSLADHFPRKSSDRAASRPGRGTWERVPPHHPTDILSLPVSRAEARFYSHY